MISFKNKIQRFNALFNTSYILVIFSRPLCQIVSEMSVCYWWKAELFEMACVTLCQSMWVESFKAFQRAETLKLTCDWERFAKQNWRPDKVDYLALSYTTCFLFSFICVCWAITKRTGVWEAARCIDSANRPPHMSFQVLAERIIIA